MKEALKLALDVLGNSWTEPSSRQYEIEKEAITAIKAALAQTAQEPVAWLDLQKEAQQIVESKSLWKRFIVESPLANDIACWMADFALQHTTPQQRPWVGLTDEDKETLILKHAPPLHPDYKDDSLHGLLQAANDFLRELNT